MSYNTISGLSYDVSITPIEIITISSSFSFLTISSYSYTASDISGNDIGSALTLNSYLYNPWIVNKWSKLNSFYLWGGSGGYGGIDISGGNIWIRGKGLASGNLYVNNSINNCITFNDNNTTNILNNFNILETPTELNNTKLIDLTPVSYIMNTQWNCTISSGLYNVYNGEYKIRYSLCRNNNQNNAGHRAFVDDTIYSYTYHYIADSSGYTSAYVDLELPNKLILDTYTIKHSLTTNPTRRVRDWTITATNDGTNWTTIDTQEDQDWNSETGIYPTYTIGEINNNNTFYNRYRLTASRIWSVSYWQLNYWQLNFSQEKFIINTASHFNQKINLYDDIILPSTTITTTELSYLQGASDPIQNQLNSISSVIYDNYQYLDNKINIIDTTSQGNFIYNYAVTLSSYLIDLHKQDGSRLNTLETNTQAITYDGGDDLRTTITNQLNIDKLRFDSDKFRIYTSSFLNLNITTRNIINFYYDGDSESNPYKPICSLGNNNCYFVRPVVCYNITISDYIKVNNNVQISANEISYLKNLSSNAQTQFNTLDTRASNNSSAIVSLSGIVWSYYKNDGFNINNLYNGLNSLSGICFTYNKDTNNRIDNLVSSTENTYLYNYGVSLSSRVYNFYQLDNANINTMKITDNYLMSYGVSLSSRVYNFYQLDNANINTMKITDNYLMNYGVSLSSRVYNFYQLDNANINTMKLTDNYLMSYGVSLSSRVYNFYQLDNANINTMKLTDNYLMNYGVSLSSRVYNFYQLDNANINTMKLTDNYLMNYGVSLSSRVYEFYQLDNANINTLLTNTQDITYDSVNERTNLVDVNLNNIRFNSDKFRLDTTLVDFLLYTRDEFRFYYNGDSTTPGEILTVSKNNLFSMTPIVCYNITISNYIKVNNNVQISANELSHLNNLSTNVQTQLDTNNSRLNTLETKTTYISCESAITTFDESVEFSGDAEDTVEFNVNTIFNNYLTTFGELNVESSFYPSVSILSSTSTIYAPYKQVYIMTSSSITTTLNENGEHGQIITFRKTTSGTNTVKVSSGELYAYNNFSNAGPSPGNGLGITFTYNLSLVYYNSAWYALYNN